MSNETKQKSVKTKIVKTKIFNLLRPSGSPVTRIFKPQ